MMDLSNTFSGFKVTGDDQAICWVNDDTYFVVRFAGSTNREYNRKGALLFKKYGNQIKNGAIEEEEARKLYARLLVDSIIVSWGSKTFGDGAIVNNGSKVEYDKELCYETLVAIPLLANTINEFAQNRENFSAMPNVEETAGN